MTFLKFIIIFLFIQVFHAQAQRDEDVFILALRKYQEKMKLVDSLVKNYVLEDLLVEVSKNSDSIYYCDFSNSKPIGELINVDLFGKNIINVDQRWLADINIFLYGIQKNDMNYDSLNIVLLYYEEGDEGLNWVKFSNNPSIEMLDQTKLKKLFKNQFPRNLNIVLDSAHINIYNYRYGLPAEIYYREKDNDFNSFNLTTEIRRFNFMKSYTFIRLDENVSVRIIHKKRKIKNFTVKYISGGKFEGTIHKPSRKLKRLY